MKVIKAENKQFLNAIHIQRFYIQSCGNVANLKKESHTVLAVISGKDFAVKSFESEKEAIEHIDKIITFCQGKYSGKI